MRYLVGYVRQLGAKIGIVGKRLDQWVIDISNIGKPQGNAQCCPINDESRTAKEAKKNAVGVHYFDCHRNEEPQLKCDMVYKTHGFLERDCMDGTAVRRIHRYNMNQRLEDNGIKFD